MKLFAIIGFTTALPSITKYESSQILSRKERFFEFEEIKQGNLERECFEENCNDEERLEVFDNHQKDYKVKMIFEVCIKQRIRELHSEKYGYRNKNVIPLEYQLQEYQNKNSMENYLNTLVRYRRSVQQQDADSWYDDSSEEYVPDRQTFDYPDVDYSVVPNQLQNMNQAERDRLRTCYKMSQQALVNIAQDSKSVDPK